MKNCDRLRAALTAGYVRRWHAEDIVGEETVAAHTWGMLVIIHILHPDPSVNLLSAVTFHDGAEPWSGDIPYFAKRAVHALGSGDAVVAQWWEKIVGLESDITSEEFWWLKFADMGQAYLFLKRQVAMGNGLMRDIALEAASILEGMRQGDDKPEGAWDAVQALFECRLGMHLTRNINELEKL